MKWQTTTTLRNTVVYSKNTNTPIKVIKKNKKLMVNFNDKNPNWVTLKNSNGQKIKLDDVVIQLPISQRF